MTNREKAKEVLERTFNLEFDNRLNNVLKGCDLIKSTECTAYQDCENCKLYHFWYSEFKGNNTPLDKSTEQILSSYKEKLRGIISEECNRKTESGEYVYSIECEKVFGRMLELIYKTTI